MLQALHAFPKFAYNNTGSTIKLVIHYCYGSGSYGDSSHLVHVPLDYIMINNMATVTVHDVTTYIKWYTTQPLTI